MSMLEIKIKYASSFDDKIPFPGAKTKLYVLRADMLVCFSETWRHVSPICLMFFVLTRYKTVLKTLLLQSSFSEWFGEQASGLVLGLAQIKLFPVLVIDCLLFSLTPALRQGKWYWPLTRCFWKLCLSTYCQSQFYFWPLSRHIFTPEDPCKCTFPMNGSWAHSFKRFLPHSLLPCDPLSLCSKLSLHRDCSSAHWGLQVHS